MGAVDFHAHILPGADHGSHSLKTSLVQLDTAKKHGIDRIVATPHFYPHKHTIDYFIKRREEAVNLLVSHLGERYPRIAVGSEVMLCVGLEHFSNLDALTIGNSRTLLVELPPNDFSDEYVSTAVCLKDMGYNVVLAHADRYFTDCVERFIREGISLQINASALLNIMKSRVMLEWIKHGYVSAFGSDVHGSDKTGFRAMLKLKRKLGALYDSVVKKTDAMWTEFETL